MYQLFIILYCFLWLPALQKAIDVDGEDIHFQKIELSKRSKKRIAARQKVAEENLQRQREQQIIQEKMKELEEEKQVRKGEIF